MSRAWAGGDAMNKKQAQLKNKFPAFLTLLIMTVLVVGGLWWLAVVSDRNRAANLKEINSNPAYGKGVITKIFYYKGHSLRVQYTIGNVTYEHIGGWTKILTILVKTIRLGLSIR